MYNILFTQCHFMNKASSNSIYADISTNKNMKKYRNKLKEHSSNKRKKF